MIQKSINYLMILFALLFPVSKGAANTLLALILLLWLIEGNFKAKFEIFKEEKISWIFLLIGLLTLLSALWSNSLYNGLLGPEHKFIIKVVAIHYIALPLLLVIFITSIQKHYLNHIVSAFLIAILVSEITSYLIFFQMIDVNQFDIFYSETSVQNPTPFLHHLEYSIFLSVAIIFLIHKMIHTPKRYLQILIGLFLLSATINLFINGGRTGQIAYLLSVTTYMIFYFRLRMKTISLTLGGLISVIVIAYNFSPTFHKRSHLALDNIQKITQGNYSSSWGARAATVQVTLDYLFSSPTHFLFGAGAGDSGKEFMKHAKQNFGANISKPIRHMKKTHLHNQYLQNWIDGTLFALILFIFYFILLIRLPVKPQDKALLYAFTMIGAFSAAVDAPFFRYQPFMLYLMFTGYFVLLSKDKLSTLKD